MAKKIAKKKEEVIEPEVVGEVEEAEEFTLPEAPKTAVGDNLPKTYTVKLDNKRFDNREFNQVFALLQGAEGTFKKVVIEVE
jgi:hypothetical protein